MSITSAWLRATRRYSSASHLARGKRFNVLFCGSDEFSVRNLDKLVAAPDLWKEIHVLTPRLRKLPIPLLEYAKAHDLQTSQVPKDGIASYTLPSPFDVPSSDNLLVTASFGHIIPNAFLARFEPNKRLNVHPSLLPQYRGAAPIQWTIANGDSSTGVSVQRLVEKGKGIDGGDIVGVARDNPVGDGATYNSLLDQVSGIGANLLVDVLRKIQAGTDQGTPQDPSQVTRAPKITHDTARIDWTAQSANQIDALSRGISHQYTLWTSIEDLAVQLYAPMSSGYTAEAHAAPGTARLLRKQGKMVVACADGSWLQVQRVKSQGKKEVGVNDWWNGLPKALREAKEIRFQ